MATLGNPTNLTSGGNATASASDTTASISPTAYSILFATVAIARGGTVPTTITISSTLSGLSSWTKIETTQSGERIALFYAICGATPGSGTITFTYSGGSGDPVRKSWIVDQILVADRTTPVSESNVGTTTGSTLSVSIGGLAAGNKIYGVIGSSAATNITSAGTGETELVENTSGGGTPMRIQSQYGSADTSCDWSNLGTTGVGSMAVVVEIAVSAGFTISVSDTPATSDVELADISVEVSDTPDVSDVAFCDIDVISSDTVLVTDAIVITTQTTPVEEGLAVTIDGVDRTQYIVFNSLKKTDNLNQQVDNLEFMVRKYGSVTFVPTIGDEVVVTKAGSTLFGGVIMRMTETTKASKIIEYKITCNDYSQYLRRNLVTERYTSTTLFAIIADIMDNYTTGFTYTSIAGDLNIESFAFNRITVAECLQKLADALSYSWYIDYDKVLHFFPKNTELAPFNLTDTSGNYIFNSLEIVEDISQLRNSILVQKGDAVSDNTRTEYFESDGITATIPLANRFSSLPTILLGGTTQSVGTEFLDDETLFPVMWNFNEKYIRWTTGNIPATASTYSVAGLYLFPIVVSVPAPESIAEFGEYEFAIKDKTINSTDEAIDRAVAELTSYKDTLYNGQFKTYEDGLRSGMVININSSQRGKDVDVLIQSVTTKMRDPIGNSFEYTVKFATLKSIGIIEFLQGQLLNDEIIEGDQETLLNFFPLTDECALTDVLDAPVASTGPYKWATSSVSTESDRLIWGYGTWT